MNNPPCGKQADATAAQRSRRASPSRRTATYARCCCASSPARLEHHRPCPDRPTAGPSYLLRVACRENPGPRARSPGSENRATPLFSVAAEKMDAAALQHRGLPPGLAAATAALASRMAPIIADACRDVPEVRGRVGETGRDVRERGQALDRGRFPIECGSGARHASPSHAAARPAPARPPRLHDSCYLKAQSWPGFMLIHSLHTTGRPSSSRLGGRPRACGFHPLAAAAR